MVQRLACPVCGVDTSDLEHNAALCEAVLRGESQPPLPTLKEAQARAEAAAPEHCDRCSGLRVIMVPNGCFSAGQERCPECNPDGLLKTRFP